jgi:antitoxin HicB
MRTWTYPAHIERHDEADYVVTFRDIPEIITGGASLEEAIRNAEDALEEVFLSYLARGVVIPLPKPARKDEQSIVLAPITASRAALANLMRDQKITNVALAARMGKSEGAIRRLMDGSANVKIDTVVEAMKALGGKAIFSDERV